MINWEHKKVLVAGGAGLIGSHMSKRLLGLGADVTVADNLSSGSRKNTDHLYVDFRECDLRDRDVCDKLVRGKDVVFQLAADMGGIGYITSIGAQIMHNSAQINLNMLNAAHKHEIPNYFYSSSACVYPEYRQLDANVTPLKESDAWPAQPDQFYGIEKLFTEKLCEAYQKDYGMNIRVARFHNVYGHGYTAFDEAKSKAPCKMILRAIQNRPIEIWNDGLQTRSFLYIEDCIDAVLKLMDSDFARPINIGSERLVTMKELAKLVADASSKNVGVEHFPNKPLGVRGRNSDNTLIREALGWEPKVPMEVGLREVYEWGNKHYSELEGI